MSNNDNYNIQKITELYDPVITEIEKFFNGMYKSRNAQNQVDFDVLKNYVSYNIAENYTRVNSLLLQAKFHLATLQGELATAKCVAIDEIKYGKRTRGYDLNADESKIMVDGHPNVVACQRALSKQTSIVNYLSSQLDALKFFPNNARAIMEMYKTNVEYGSGR